LVNESEYNNFTSTQPTCGIYFVLPARAAARKEGASLAVRPELRASRKYQNKKPIKKNKKEKRKKNGGIRTHNQ
jgi:hypothetical protein